MTMTEINLPPELDNLEPEERRRLITYLAAMRELERRDVQIPLEASILLHFSDPTALQRLINTIDKTIRHPTIDKTIRHPKKEEE